MRNIPFLVLLYGSFAVAAGPTISVNGQPHSPAAQVIGGQTFIPISVLNSLGVPYQLQGNRLLIGSAASAASSPGGANQRTSLSGCQGEWLFNGVWRVKVGSLRPIQKDGDTPGWGVDIEVRNGTKTTMNLPDAGWGGNGQGVNLVFADGNSLAVDPYDVQKLTYHSFPQASSFNHQLKFYAPEGMSAINLKSPSKLLIEIDPKGIGFSIKQSGVAFTTPTPSFRIDLTCSH